MAETDPMLDTAEDDLGRAIPWPAGCTPLPALRVVVLRHRPNRAPAGQPASLGELQPCPGGARWRRDPGEVVLVTADRAEADALLHAAPSADDAPPSATFDLSDGIVGLELASAQLDDWLARLVDALSVPVPGRATRARLVDVPALLVRWAPDRLWLLVDRSLARYAADWLQVASADLPPD